MVPPPPYAFTVSGLHDPDLGDALLVWIDSYLFENRKVKVTVSLGQETFLRKACSCCFVDFKERIKSVIDNYGPLGLINSFRVKVLPEPLDCNRFLWEDPDPEEHEHVYEGPPER